MRIITPSKISPWEGTPVEGSRYTAQQLAAMKRERPTWTSFTDRIVTLTSPKFNHRWPREQIGVACPIIAWTKDRARVLIITPAGDQQWIAAQFQKRKTDYE